MPWTPELFVKGEVLAACPNISQSQMCIVILYLKVLTKTS